MANTPPVTDPGPPAGPKAEAPAAPDAAVATAPAPTAGAPKAPSPKAPAVPEGSVRVTVHANLSLGGVILAVDQVGVVPDDAETRACAAAGLLSIEV